MSIITIGQTTSFVNAYIECALWSSTGPSDEPLDDTYSAEDFTDTARQAMQDDCESFLKECGPVFIRHAIANDRDVASINYTQHGHDFWLTRNGHGAGYWDRGYGALGDDMTSISEPYGSCDIYPTDNGQLDIN